MQDLLTIATCEMKEEDMEAQCLFWECLNEVMEDHGCERADFFGFMADEAQANWNAVRQVFNGGKQNVMEERERSCLFHWEQSMVGHTTKYVRKDVHNEHKAMCEKWRMAPTSDAAMCEARLIRQWWRNGNVMDRNVAAMDSWLSWWEVRIAHWGSVMTAVERSIEGPNTPRTNLAESKHGSWLAGEGFRKRISLYDACTTDLANAILQSTKTVSYAQGKHIGRGPSLEKLKERISARPAQVVRAVNEATEGTPMYKAPSPLTGDKETSRHKRPSTVVIDIDDDASHRPEYNAHVRDRKYAGRPRKLHFQETNEGQGRSVQDSRETCVHERKVNEAMWAIRRTPIGSKVTCSGTPRGGKRCGQHIAGAAKGVPAPSFEGYRKHPNGVLRQWMWFCPDHVIHCYVVDNNIDPKPAPPPKIWPVNVGTNLTSEEVNALLEGGYEVERPSGEQQLNPPSSIGVGRSNTPPQSNTPLQSNFTAGQQDASSSATRNGIRVKFRTSISQEAIKKINLALKLKGKVVGEVCQIQHTHEIFKVESHGDDGHIAFYDVHVKKEPSCTCPSFVEQEEKGSLTLHASTFTLYIYVFLV